MSKDYSEQLGQWVKQRRSTRRDKNVVAFLAVKDDVQKALNDGHAVMTVWKNMVEVERIEFCYSTFLIYVNRIIRPKSVSAQSLGPAPVSKTDARKVASKPKAVPVVTAPASMPGFTFNATPRKEDLL